LPAQKARQARAAAKQRSQWVGVSASVGVTTNRLLRQAKYNQVFRYMVFAQRRMVSTFKFFMQLNVLYLFCFRANSIAGGDLI
jgi:hypothetical protein